MRKESMNGRSNTKYTTYELRADRPMMVKPLILRQYYDADGLRMYKTIDDRDFIADVYDEMFIPKVNREILPRRRKIDEDGTRKWMQDI